MFVRNFGAAIAAAVLVLLTVPATGAAAQYAESTSHHSTSTITSPAPFTNDATPVFSGTAVGQVVQVRTGAHSHLLCVGQVVHASWSCTSAPLADGVYTVFTTTTPGPLHRSAPSTFTLDTKAPAPTRILAPAGPATGGVIAASISDARPVISGSGEPHATVSLFVDGVPASCATSPIVVDSTGGWSCPVARSLAVGLHLVGSFQTDRAGNSSTAGSPHLQLRLTVTSSAPAPSTIPPAVTPHGPASHATHVVPQTSPRASITAVSRTRPAAPPIRSDAPVIRPAADVPSQAQLPTLALPDTSPEKNHGSQHRKAAGTPGVDRNTPWAPTSLTHALSTLQQVFANPVVLGTAVGSASAFLLLVALPAELLTSTLAREYELLFGRFRRLRAHWLERLRGWFSHSPFAGGVALTMLAALIFGFADPHFGPDITSLRLVLACGIALIIVGHLTNAITGWIVRERWRVGTLLEVKPLALILTVVGVFLSRLLGFSPGFLIGLIVGMSLTGTTTVRQRSRTVLVHGGIILTFGVLAWLGFSALTAITGGHPTTFVQALSLDTFAAIAAEGLTILLIGLLPFRYLDGEDVFAESKTLWALSYLSVLTAFCVIVLPVAAHWEEIGDSLWLWLGCFVGFTLFSVGVYLYFRFAPSSRREPTSETAEAAATETRLERATKP